MRSEHEIEQARSYVVRTLCNAELSDDQRALLSGMSTALKGKIKQPEPDKTMPNVRSETYGASHKPGEVTITAAEHERLKRAAEAWDVVRNGRVAGVYGNGKLFTAYVTGAYADNPDPVAAVLALAEQEEGT